METRDDEHGIGIVFDDVKQRVRKAAQQGAPHVFVDNRELQRVGADSLGHLVDGSKEAAAQTVCFAFIPVLRVDQFRPRSLSEPDRIH